MIAMGLGPLAAHAGKFPCLRGLRLLNERLPGYFYSAQEESCIRTDTIESRSTGVFVYLRMTARGFGVYSSDGIGTPLFLEMRVKISDLCCPCDTQSVQDELISKTQHTGVQGGSKCVMNVSTLCGTPEFVTNDSVTVDTG